MGAQNVIDAAIDCGVKKVIAISTDEAVSPVNIYGATTLCAEKLFVHGNFYSREGRSRFACSRYGNMAGRVDFVIRCIGLMQGGEVFVPKLPSMRVIDLARVLAPEARIDVMGIRPGEKVHEVLVSEDEARHGFELDDMDVIGPPDPSLRRGAGPIGRPLAEGFRYTSDTNSRWLTPEDLRVLVHAVGGG